jgi:radical SAM protein with 4Fe4S-binding SPASM domain
MTKKWNIGWGVTGRCNMNCKHCYNYSGKAGFDELSLNDIKRIIDKIQGNIESINYGTGELTLRKDWLDIVKYVAKKGILQGLTTNGYSVNKNTIIYLKKYMNDIDVSIDFPTEKKHNNFRGNKNAWIWANNALMLLKENNLSRSVVCCLTSKNCKESYLKTLSELAKKYDANLRINWFRPTGRGKINQELKLSVKQAHNSFRWLVQNNYVIAIPDPYFSAILGLKNQVGCICGKSSFRITPNGSTVPCVYFTKELKNFSISNCSFNKIIHSKPFNDIKNRNCNICYYCEYFKNCRGGCASRAFLENNSLNSPDPFCYKAAGIKKNPLYSVKPEFLKNKNKFVHENYLCTLILKPK